jgi:antitoxin FitA
MASITIRKLDDGTKARLRPRAARNQRSIEEEARTLLRTALAEEGAAPSNLADAIRARFRSLGGVEHQIPAREPMRVARRGGGGVRKGWAEAARKLHGRGGDRLLD